MNIVCVSTLVSLLKTPYNLTHRGVKPTYVLRRPLSTLANLTYQRHLDALSGELVKFTFSEVKGVSVDFDVVPSPLGTSPYIFF